MVAKLQSPFNAVLRMLPGAHQFEIGETDFCFEWRGNFILVGLSGGEPAVKQYQPDEKHPAAETAVSYLIGRLIL